MRPSSVRRWPVLALTSVASLPLLTGCGGDDDGDDASVPEGFAPRSAETPNGAVSIAYPDDWGELERSEADGATIYSVASPEGDAFVELRVIEDTGASFEASSQVAAAATAANSGFSFEIDEQEGIDIDGAVEAERVTFGPGTEADEETGTLVAVFAETDAGSFISVGAGAEPDVEVDLPAIVGSLQIEE